MQGLKLQAPPCPPPKQVSFYSSGCLPTQGNSPASAFSHHGLDPENSCAQCPSGILVPPSPEAFFVWSMFVTSTVFDIPKRKGNQKQGTFWNSFLKRTFLSLDQEIKKKKSWGGSWSKSGQTFTTLASMGFLKNPKISPWATGGRRSQSALRFRGGRMHPGANGTSLSRHGPHHAGWGD